MKKLISVLTAVVVFLFLGSGVGGVGFADDGSYGGGHGHGGCDKGGDIDVTQVVISLACAENAGGTQDGLLEHTVALTAENSGNAELFQGSIGVLCQENYLGKQIGIEKIATTLDLENHGDASVGQLVFVFTGLSNSGELSEQGVANNVTAGMNIDNFGHHSDLVAKQLVGSAVCAENTNGGKQYIAVLTTANMNICNGGLPPK